MSEPNILFNEAQFSSLDESKRPTFVFEWLQRLNKVISSSSGTAKLNLSVKEQEGYIQNKELIRKHQKQIVAQLSNLMQNGGSTIGPIVRQLIADSFVGLFVVGDTFLLFETINKYSFFLQFIPNMHDEENVSGVTIF